ncbi:parB-like nuclease domain protein (plasmid) [Blastomonas sp. RAC04]|uniref:ParB/RepB/Spo0J family partition protein n=1 Tax=Blastomonas sp. RAC04 TaxID=1842535 RepID=UPI000856362F|nr:ParB/RepB/Spo0J family partition protein [Blastomonas sp. RAC04]AOF98702.1 parB-like nuclease domain protein [Blastomonas sp. RAC04]
MARSKPTITLSPSRDIPFDRLVLSQSNVRQIKCGLSIAELAEDIARRGLLQSLNVRTVPGTDGTETGMFEIPAGGRRYRALEMLVKQKRLSRTAPVPCIVQQASAEILAEEDSLAENAMREPLHPLDQFRAMLSLVDKGQQVEAIAAHFMTTPAVVRQRLKLAAVSPKLHEIYAEDGMTLDQLMAFTVSDDHQRQEQVWELLGHSYNRSAGYIRHKLTENTVRVADKRVRFVTEAAYVAAGGSVVRDLFEPDDGGWLTDVALLDRLVDEKLARDAERILAEGWKWVESAIDLPWNATSGMRRVFGSEIPITPEEAARLAALEAQADELSARWSDAPEIPPEVDASIDAVEAEIGALVDRPAIFDPEDMTCAGAFVSIDTDGSLRVERGLVRPDDDAADPNVVEMDTPAVPGSAGEAAHGSDAGRHEAQGSALSRDDDTSGDTEEGDALKPLPDRLVSDLTAWRTLALQDAFAKDPATAFAAVLHAMVLSAFYSYSHESCLQLTLHPVHFSSPPEGLRDSAPAHAIAQRHAAWTGRLPQADTELWDALLALDADDQACLFAHCASLGLNAQAEIVPKYDNGRISRRSIERRIAHSHVIARAVELDIIASGWRPTVEGYFRSVTKPRILADVTEARGEQFAGMIDHLKKADMAREAERLLEETNWLPEPLRTPGEEGTPSQDAANDDGAGALPPGLTKDIDGEAEDTGEDHGGADAIAAE